MRTKRWIRAAYDALLHLLPRAFRDRFGDEMALDFREALAGTARPRAMAALTLSAIADVVRTAAAQWLRDEILRATAAAMCLLTLLWLPVVLLAARQWPDGPSLLPLFAQLSCLSLPLVYVVIARRRTLTAGGATS